MDRVQYESIVIQDLVNLSRSDELNLSPWYQRRSVWTTPQKAYLINTLLEQKPIPAIYVRHSIDIEKGKSIREVVDGQQRTRTILDFCVDRFLAFHPGKNRKLRFSHLTDKDKQNFLLTSIPVGYLLGATDEDVIEIFGRINSVSKTLNAQERRNARYSGDFKQFCLRQAASRLQFWRAYGIFSANDIARMNEVQFVSDVVLNMLNGLSDFGAQRLDAIYEKYDSDFPSADAVEKRLDRVFDLLVQIDPQLFRETVFNRQPIFFSLMLVIDSLDTIPRSKLEEVILEVDARFRSEDNFKSEDLGFRSAASASTQRIAQRTTRDGYIRSFLA